MKKAKIALAFVLIAILPLLYFMLVPDVSKLKKENPKKTALMEFREKQSKEKGKKLRIDQRWVPLSKISPYLSKSVLIAEDDSFGTMKASITRRYKRR